MWRSPAYWWKGRWPQCHGRCSGFPPGHPRSLTQVAIQVRRLRALSTGDYFPCDWAILPCWLGPSPCYLCCRLSWVCSGHVVGSPIGPFCILCKNQHPFPVVRGWNGAHTCFVRPSLRLTPTQHLLLWRSKPNCREPEHKTILLSAAFSVYLHPKGESQSTGWPKSLLFFFSFPFL